MNSKKGTFEEWSNIQRGMEEYILSTREADIRRDDREEGIDTQKEALSLRASMLGAVKQFRRQSLTSARLAEAIVCRVCKAGTGQRCTGLASVESGHAARSSLMRTPLAGERWHMRRPIQRHRRIRRYRRAGGIAPPRAVPLERVVLTAWADGWRPRRHWILKGYTPPAPAIRASTRSRKPKPETRQLALDL